MIGQTVAHYKILEKLGEGGMGVVYKAHDTKLDRDVALKFLPPSLSSDPFEKERFFQEAKAASALNHPNICTIYEIGEHLGQVFIAMEYVEGKSLKQLSQEAPLPIRKVLDIAISVCEGLAAAAERGVVHRDIKSDNILLTGKGQVKIMDFGLAKVKGASPDPGTGSTMGTAAYMSPEQSAGEDVDHRSDIFSFGVVLYELLAGRLPFQGEHPAGYAYSILNEEPPPLARFSDKVTPELQRIVSKVLAKDKTERYQHIDDLAADLRHERKKLDYVKSSVSSGPEAVHRPSRKLLTIVLPTSAVLLLILLFLTFNPFKFEIYRDQTAEASQNTLAVMYFENLPDPEDKDHSGEMLANLLITSLSQVQGLEVISRERLYDIQKELGKAEAEKITPALATQIAQRAGVKTILLGSILQKQPQLVLTARLIDVKSGRIVSSQRLTGYSDDQMFPMVDSLAVLVRNGLNITPTAVTETKSVAEVTTSSPEAYRSYVEGIELMDKFYLAEARAAFKKALELDSNFAMVYYRLAGVGEDERARRAALQNVWALRGKVTEKERLAIEALYAAREQNDLPKAASMYEELLKKYPHEQPYYADLASTYLGQNDYLKAIQTYQTGLKYDSLDKNLLNLLAYINAGLNQRQPAFEAIDRYLRLAPGEPNPYDSKGELFFVFGDIDSALLWYGGAVALRADFASSEKLGFNAVVRGNYPTALKYFRQFGSTSDESQKMSAGIDSGFIPLHQGQMRRVRRLVLDEFARQPEVKTPEMEARFYVILAYLAYEERDYSAMLDYSQKFSAARRKIPGDKFYGLDLLALAWLKTGKPERAHQIAKDLKRVVSSKRPAERAWYDCLLGLLALEEGRGSQAAKFFDQALQPYFPNRAPSFFYGLALVKAGRTDEAIRELGRASWWSPISTNTFNLDFLPFSGAWPVATVKAHYWLGVAYEQKGDKAKAQNEYEKFLEIWKEADFNSPELADAKARLAKLNASAKS